MKRLFIQENKDKHVLSIALKTASHRRCQESSDEDTFSLLSKKFNKFLKKNNTRITPLKGIVAKIQMILTLISIPVLVVVSRDTSKQIVPTVRTKRK